MKIGIISDTHNQISLIRKALGIFKNEKVGIIIHVGDMDMASTLEEFKAMELPVKMVIGNIDEEPERFIEKAKRLNIDFFLNSFIDIDAEIDATKTDAEVNAEKINAEIDATEIDAETNAEAGADADAERGHRGRRIYVFHGNVRGRLDDVINTLVKSKKYDVIIYGHTHVPKQEVTRGVLVLNPGSLEPLVVGVKPSVAIYDVDIGKARIIEI